MNVAFTIRVDVTGIFLPAFSIGAYGLNGTSWLAEKNPTMNGCLSRGPPCVTKPASFGFISSPARNKFFSITTILVPKIGFELISGTAEAV